jgi:kynurenine formamidase
MSKYGTGPGADQEKFFSAYPGLSPNAPGWFIDRKVRTVGCDTINVDVDNSVPSHINFLMRERINKQPIQMIENLANLDQIPVSRFTFVGLPLPIRGASGSPIRAIAVIE